MAGITITWKPEGIVDLASLTTEKLRDALATMGSELSKPKGRGLGVAVNTLSYDVTSGLVNVESSLVWPRTTGESWLARSESDAENIAGTALEAAKQAIVVGVGN